MSLVFWAWITIVFVCALAESVTGGLLTLPWSFGAGLAAILEAFHVGMGWQWAAFVLLSSALLVAAQRLIVQRRK